MSQTNAGPPPNQPSTRPIEGVPGSRSALTLEQAKLRATEAYNRGAWSEAENWCRSMLEVAADDFETLTLLGIITAQTQRKTEAAHHLARAAAVSPENPWAHNNLGRVLAEIGRFAEALNSHERALELRPDYADAHYNRGVALHQLKRFEEAVDSYGLALRFGGDDADIHHNRGVALQALKRHAEAADSYRRATGIRPDLAEAHANLGDSLADLGRLLDSLQSYERALELNPDAAAVHFNRGVVLQALERFDEALASYGHALRLRPDYAKAHTNHGNVLLSRGRFADALESYECAVQLAPDLLEAQINRGIALHQLNRFDQALRCHDHVLNKKPDCAEAHHNRGLALHAMNSPLEAVHSYERALQINPGYAEAHESRAHALRDLQQHEAAIAAYDRAIELNPKPRFLPGLRQHVKMKICEWHGFDETVELIRQGIERDEEASPPFPVLALADSPALQRRAAALWVERRCLPPSAPLEIPRRAKHERIRVAYFSADYRDHPVSTLTAELFETHDRSRIELIAFSLGPDTGDQMRSRMVQAFDQFIDVRQAPDRDIVELCRQREVDIAVDLGGLTGDGRLARIFALRPAPLQVSYLGYLGSIGVEFMDYLIADATLVPDSHTRHFSEKIIYLPSYQVNDTQRPISQRKFGREELGLPPHGFVFCCFNANYKITPPTFDSWMRILKAVDGSVLFLSADNHQSKSNLRKEAGRRGIDDARLVFGDRLPMQEYLARYRSADLFLDTLPYNAGTTASDALWAGLPVLTLIGEAFPGRVAASLLTAIGLPELVTTSRRQYEHLAVELAGNTQRLAGIKRTLARNRQTFPLFDTHRFAHHLESAYSKIYARYAAGLTPEHVVIDPGPT